MQFRVTLPVEVERPSDDFTVSVKLSVDIAYHGGRWRGQCADPPLVTPLCETLEQALVAIAKEIERDAGA